MTQITVDVPASLKASLERVAEETGQTCCAIVTAALSRHLEVPIHTLFQVSTSGALVAGVYSGAVTVKTILDHGDFGLGTFADLDGEMVVLDGRVYQVQGSGRVSEAPPQARAPFAVVTHLTPQVDAEIETIADFADLEKHCDSFRTSGNIFYALRVEGRFDRVLARAVNPVRAGGLVDAAKKQSEFHFTDIVGTLVGLWSPGFTSAFSVPGYHFHFLSADLLHGGHLLDCSAGTLHLQMDALTEFHLALPETESFLKADLSKTTADELAYAEKAHD